jgi:hypothetical protein
MPHGSGFVRGWIDHAFPPVADILAIAAAKLLPADFAARVACGISGIEPAMVAGLAVADRAEAGVEGVHASNLYWVTSVNRPFDRMKM